MTTRTSRRLTNGPRADLDEWLRGELPAAREELADAFREMLGVKKWRRGVLRSPL